MASQDPIDAKFETLESRLESRLEDKLRALFAEFKIGQPPSPTKFQEGESLERPPEKEGQPSEMLQPRMRGCLLLIEPTEDMEEVQEHKEEVAKEEQQVVDFTTHALVGYANPQTMKVGGLLKQQLITILIDIGSTNNFMNSKVVVWMALPIEDCSKFDVKVIVGRILKCDRRCPRVKLLLQDQEIIAYFFLLPVDDYEAKLGIEWLTTLGDVS
ncbi:hypothetical protein BHE74_00034297 [Ensete ventricosum]|nr:hypothetical protein GW17_00053499 [Ensete ventricosum]RWW58807.1 hypothetical protein BHE74_00034297 [Ensete ventricosum]